MRAFSVNWKSSTKPSKQRKYRYNAPLHLRKKFMSVHLSSEMSKKHGVRNLPVRVGDTVKIIKGDFKGKSSKVERVNLRKSLVYVQGVERQRRDGTKSLLGIAPANVIISDLITDDKRRLPAKQGDKK